MLSTRLLVFPTRQPYHLLRRTLFSASKDISPQNSTYLRRYLNFNKHQSPYRLLRFSVHYSSSTPTHKKVEKESESKSKIINLKENIYTLPNALTLSRILSCPLLGWFVLDGNFAYATGILAYAAISDWFDGFLARRFQMRSVLGTILDPAADKILMTTLTVTLAMKGMIPVPLAFVILGRDALLVLTAFYVRYKSLPSPKTLQRYWDPSILSAEVHPTKISKINTALQLLLMGVTTVSPLLTFQLGLALQTLQWTVAGTTVWSGFSYVFSSTAVRFITSESKDTRNNESSNQ